MSPVRIRSPAPYLSRRRAVRQLRGQTAIPRASLSTKHLHSLPVVFEVAESVRLPADGFHFVVKAFCDSVGPSKAPHARDFLGPGTERVAERDQLRKPGLT